MKKLYLNINKIHIKAKDPSILSTLVADIDKQMQALVMATDSVKTLVSKYSGNNNGIQYENACRSLQALSLHMRDSALIINDLEMQVVAFQNKVYRFEGSNKSAPMPRKYVVAETRVNANTANIQYGTNEMRAVSTALSQYCERAKTAIKGIMMARNRISSVWLDPQFKDFSSVIEGVRVVSEKHIKELEAYVMYLNVRIKELMS